MNKRIAQTIIGSEISRCYDCPSYDAASKHSTDGGWVCTQVEIGKEEYKSIPNPAKIPRWCPLPKPEPKTRT